MTDDAPLSRRALLLGAGGGVALTLPLLGPLARPGLAAEEPPRDRRARREAIRRGCAWIAKQQHPNGGGAFGDQDGIVAITALSVLALMAGGSTDGRGPHGDEIRAGIDFLLRLVEEPKHGGTQYPAGYFYYPQDPSSRMHGQGFATLALAAALGTSTDRRDRRIRDVVKKAVGCIEQAQTRSGGFGYEPTPGQEHEGSVTVTVAQGLRAARDAGIPVNQNVVDRGLHYLKRSQNADGSFRYSVHTERSSYALTAAALSSFFLFGKYADDREQTIRRGLEYMMGKISERAQSLRWFYYGNFYAAWACWQRDGGGWDAGSQHYWYRWQRRMYPRILQRQSTAQGSWEDPQDQFNFGQLVPTTFAVLALAIPDEVLPIFQR